MVSKKAKPDIRNIKTNKDKIYKIERAEFLVNDKDKTMLGIVVITIYDSNGNKLKTIGGWSET